MTPLQVNPGGSASRPPPRKSSGPHSAVSSGVLRRPRVLIVDDNDETRDVYAWCMRAAGWQAEAVADGAEALAVVHAFEPDVIVMDLALPIIDGISATKRLKA
jgi:PleD family two-component response regulator